MGRCRVVAGDLLEEGCGVTETIAGATHFWHCAASLRYENRFVDEIRATNVEGTRHALDLARSLGGPLFNLLMAGTFSMFSPLVSSGFWSALMASLISTNLFFGIGGFLPIPSVDGEVIWREIFRAVRGGLESG